MSTLWIIDNLKVLLNLKRNLRKRIKRSPRNRSLKKQLTELSQRIAFIKNKNRSDYYTEQFQDSSIKNQWRSINNILGSKSKKLTEIQTDNGLISDPVKISNVLNEFFAEIGEKITSDLPTATRKVDSTRRENLSSKSCSNSIFLAPVTCNDVLVLISKLNTNKGPGWDKIRPFDLKQCAYAFAPYLTDCFNHCIFQIYN